MRRLDGGAGRGACGRGMNAPPNPRAVTGLRLEALGPPARSWLMAGQHGASKVRRHGGPEGAVFPRAEDIPAIGCRKRGPLHRKTPRWRAERRRIFPKGRCAIDYQTRLLGAPSPRILRGTEQDDGVPGAAKSTGDFAWLFEKRIGEAQIEAAHHARLSLPRKGSDKKVRPRAPHTPLIPAQAEIQHFKIRGKDWMPASAGMSGEWASS